MKLVTAATPELEHENRVDCIQVPLMQLGAWIGQIKRAAGSYGETLGIAAEINAFAHGAITERKVVACVAQDR